MSKKAYSLIEIILSVALIIFGVGILTSNGIVSSYLQYVMISFIGIKILLNIFYIIRFKTSLLIFLIETLLNISIVVCLFIFNDVAPLSFVVSTSCFVDVGMNIIKHFVNKNSDNEEIKSFSGIENIFYLIFILLLVFNKDSDLIATGVLFGTIILYKGIAVLLSNYFLRSLICKTALGKSINKLHALDVLFGLIIIIVLASCILPIIEPSIETVGDALWYCFAIITTIGFGDITAKTVLGRIITVIMGFYGLVIVSILTSVIVVYITKKKQ